MLNGNDGINVGKEKFEFKRKNNANGVSKDKGKSMNDNKVGQNRYSALNTMDMNDDLGLSTEKMQMKDKYVERKEKPPATVFSTWNAAMIHYFKEKWDASLEIIEEEMEDVMENNSGDGIEMVQNVVHGIASNIRDMSTFKKQKEIRKLIKDEKTEAIRVKLKNAQSLLDQFPHNDLIKEDDVKVLEEYNEDMKDEESLLFHKAKVNWMMEGDKNTAYFHTVVKEKFHRSRIVSICDEAGVRHENEHVVGQFVDHFQNFLGCIDKVAPFPQDEGLFPTILSTEEAESMIIPVLEKEIVGTNNHFTSYYMLHELRRKEGRN
uniref:RNA-directed DNA polymerase, eukaryota, reverse transcriptase zinc-binding domain protein n=1 Tax=Tanacetum cinerariifolium TaxID=118510 RepID=A0A6L2JQ52_TANCI|nr:hypothetical protein [Tanacetum cinerariifolium]